MIKAIKTIALVISMFSVFISSAFFMVYELTDTMFIVLGLFGVGNFFLVLAITLFFNDSLFDSYETLVKEAKQHRKDNTINLNYIDSLKRVALDKAGITHDEIMNEMKK